MLSNKKIQSFSVTENDWSLRTKKRIFYFKNHFFAIGTGAVSFYHLIMALLRIPPEIRWPAHPHDADLGP